MPDQRLIKIFKNLSKYYGPRHWWPADTRFEVIAGAILTQNVSWHNAKGAINNLKRAKLLTPAAIAKVPRKKLAGLIRQSRFYNQKAVKLKVFCKYLLERYDGSLNKLFAVPMETLREELLAMKGIGRETADAILLYAGGKPSFVSDAYTRRFLTRYGILPDADYDAIRDYFMKHLPLDVNLYNEFHALIDHHSNHVCKAAPDCMLCPVRNIGGKIRCRQSDSRSQLSYNNRRQQ